MTDPAAEAAESAARNPFSRYEARVLDPATAVRLPGGPPPSSTVYRGDTLLFTARSRAQVERLVAAVAELAAELELRVVGPDAFTEIEDASPEIEGADGEQDRRRIAGSPGVPAHNKLARLLGLAEQAGVPLVVPIRFESSRKGPAPAVDVWPLLQAVRASNDAELAPAVGLDHLMFCAATISGNPFSRGMALIGGDPFSRGMATIGGDPFSRGMSSGVSQYLAGGSGGHGPVSVVLAPPQRTARSCSPHVVVLDTGVGDHPWFAALPVERRLTLDNGDTIGRDVDDPAVMATDPEADGAVPDKLTGLLATHAGHGTFISGLLRQTCPDADITSLRIMDGDGVVAEDELAEALMALGVRLYQNKGTG